MRQAFDKSLRSLEPSGRAMARLLSLLGGLLLLTSGAADESHDNLKAFPPAAAGTKRYVVHLQPRDDEADLRVELIVGRRVEVDPVNRYFFMGRLEARNIEGWGYTRYVLDALGPMGGTLMAPYPSGPTASRFVTLGGEPFLVRYNSRLPIVIYVPTDCEVRYRVWQAAPEAVEAPAG
jgi:ecotin